MTPADKDRYLAAYEAAFPGDIDGRSEDERDTIADQLYWDYHYGAANAPDLCRSSARALRAALGIVDRPEPPTASDLAARLAEVERERDEARAARDRLQAILDAERGVRGPEGWVYDEHGSGAWRRADLPASVINPYRGCWSWRRGRIMGDAPTALEAMEAADAAAKEEG